MEGVGGLDEVEGAGVGEVGSVKRASRPRARRKATKREMNGVIWSGRISLSTGRLASECQGNHRWLTQGDTSNWYGPSESQTAATASSTTSQVRRRRQARMNEATAAATAPAPR